jgi:dTMP kinase
MLIAFEGIDGAGKTTLVRQVAYLLCTKNVQVSIIAFPTKSRFGQLARSIINAGDNLDNLQKVCYLDFLHMQPKLMGDQLVLLDRYIWSNIVYNSSTDFFDYDELKLPDLTVYIDEDVDIAFSRSKIDRLTADISKQKERQSTYELLTKQIESDKLLFIDRKQANKGELITNTIHSKILEQRPSY